MDKTQEIDKGVVNLMKALKQHESGGNYSLPGKSGEYGAYQYTPSTFKNYAKQYANLPDADINKPEDQDKVTYYSIKGMKDKGYTPEQVLSEWNSGDKDAYKRDHVGTNKYGVKYNTPEYVEMVKKIALQETGQTPQEVPQTPVSETKPKEETLGQELGGRINKGATAVKEGLSGKQNLFSGLLQAGGQIAGAVGDLTSKGISAITPDFIEKPITEGIGKLASAAANTETGKKVVGAISKFSQEHPEASANIGAITNIVSAIPILKGVGLAKNLVMDASSLALKKTAEKVALRDLTKVIEKTAEGRKAIVSNPKAVETLINERALPNIVDGKYETKEAFERLGQQITDVEENKLQSALQKANTQSIGDRRPLEALRKEALNMAEKELKSEGNVGKAKAEINRVFDDYKNSYGDYVSLQDVNDMKRGIRRSVNFNSPKLESDVTYHIGQALQKDIEESAARLGLGDIKAINQEMADLIKAQNTLKYIEGKSVKTGLVGEAIKNTATVAGEVAGNATGVPLAGAFVGRGIGGNIGKKLTGGVEGILKRTGKDAQRVSKDELKKKIPGLFTGLGAQKITNQKKDSPRK